MNRVIIDGVWYVMNGKEYIIHEWPIACQEIFKELFKINCIVNK